MAVFDIIAAFIMGALSGMGIGGGGLLVIYLTLFKRIGQIEAQGLNLYFFLFASIASLFIHYKKRKIDYKKVLLLGASGMVSAYFGSYLASKVSPYTLRVLFGVMLLLAGGISLGRQIPQLVRRKKERGKSKKTLYK